MIKGITKRWLLNTFGVIVVIIVMIVVCAAFFVRSLYYNSIEQTISGRGNELVNVFSAESINNSADFLATAREYVENFPDKELMELMVISSADKIIITSTGFSPDQTQAMPDYEMARSAVTGYGKWRGKLNSGENVVAVTRAIYNSGGEYMGAFRYVVSLEEADGKVLAVTAIFIAAAVLIIAFVYISGSYFIRSIVNPVREMSATAKQIAQGDFDAKLEKRNNDEIGELCDSINYMAHQLGLSEKLKNDFISSVSHELRTPLTAIKGWAETMQMSGAEDKATFDKGMNVIVKESSRLTGIVEELLDFSRLQNGRMVLMMDKIDILAELSEAVYMLKERALSEGKHLLYDEPELTAAVMGDKNRLRQVFINIIDNALKYTDEGGVVGVQVKLNKENINIIISDNGCGISPEDLPRVKDKFFKANQTVRGSGIGLAVADEIVGLHKGTLELESSPGVGTTVTITLPVLQEDGAAPYNPSADVSRL